MQVIGLTALTGTTLHYQAPCYAPDLPFTAPSTPNTRAPCWASDTRHSPAPSLCTCCLQSASSDTWMLPFLLYLLRSNFSREGSPDHLIWNFRHPSHALPSQLISLLMYQEHIIYIYLSIVNTHWKVCTVQEFCLFCSLNSQCLGHCLAHSRYSVSIFRIYQWITELMVKKT